MRLLFFKILIGAWCVFGLQFAKAQNLVTNNSFEDYNSCPHGFGTMDTSTINFPTVKNWYEPNLGTSDYYNVCGDSIISVPHNFAGYQFARTGNAYCGLICYQSEQANTREYLQTRLSEPMVKNKIYCVQFYVSPAEASVWNSRTGTLSFTPIAINSFGAYFSKNKISNFLGGTSIILASPQVKNDPDTIITDTAHWLLISGLMTSSGGEQYLTIGNFKADAEMQKSVIRNGNGQEIYQAAYIYIDDVFVIPTDIIYKPLAHEAILCDHDSLVLDVTNPLATGYLWSDGSTSPVYVIHSSGKIHLKVFFGECGAISDSISAYYYNTPQINLGDDTTICNGQSVTLSATGDDNPDFLWQDQSMLDHLVASVAGTYWVKVTNFCGTGADTIRVSVTDCSCKANMPNAFTPNGDGINDEIKPILTCDELNEYSMKIFDRWGELVFESSDPNVGWNGFYKNRIMPLGVYTYVISLDAFVDGANGKKFQRGSFVLLK